MFIKNIMRAKKANYLFFTFRKFMWGRICPGQFPGIHRTLRREAALLRKNPLYSYGSKDVTLVNLKANAFMFWI
jgi:hypothetical protein